MILGRSTKPRSRASIACAGCRARRTKCILAKGQSACDRCLRLSKTCILRDDDERKRPVTRAQVHALLRRIDTLEQALRAAGLAVPPDDAVVCPDDRSRERSMQDPHAMAAAVTLPSLESTIAAAATATDTAILSCIDPALSGRPLPTRQDAHPRCFDVAGAYTDAYDDERAACRQETASP